MTRPDLFSDLVDAWLLSGTLDGSLEWEIIDDPDDPDGDSAVRLVRSPFGLHNVTVRSERMLRIEAYGKFEERRIEPGLYWSARGSTHGGAERPA